jgi:malonyl-CoA decarboxylase
MNSPTSPTWLDQVGGIAERGRAILNLGAKRRLGSIERLCRRLIEQRGEATSIALASALVESLERMGPAEIERFLALLAERFSPDPARLEAAVEDWRQAPGPTSVIQLGAAAEPPRQELFRRLNVAPGGTAAIVALRARLLEMLPRNPALEVVDADLRHLLSSWFNRGFLRLEEISWQTPAAILERLIQYEAVHEIRGWDDLHRRLAADRRCFAFFHPALPGVPLIFVEVALTRGLAGKIAPLIDPEREVGDPSAADTAIFYSISSTQLGLRGISFGSFLIKQVVSELGSRLPNLKRFATLSPLPGLAATLLDRSPGGFTPERLRRLLPDADELLRLLGAADAVQAAAILARRPGPHPEPVRRALERLALAYVLRVRQDRGGHPTVADPVANFHLSNGARLERINPDADLSDQGLASCGVMANYLYEPSELEINHERYVERGEVVMSREVGGRARALQAAWRPTPRR